MGITKNACDRMFNTLKEDYHSKNIYTMAELVPILNRSERVTVREAREEDFFDYGTFLNLFYSKFTKKVKHNHIFTATHENRVGNQLLVDLRESNLVEHKVEQHKAIKSGFFGKKKYRMNANGLKEAVAVWPCIIREAMATRLLRITANGINIYKQLELWKNYRLHVSGKAQRGELYQEPTKELIEAVLTERGQRKTFLEKLNAVKKEFMKGQRSTKKKDLLRKVDMEAVGKGTHEV